jgi:hypothetical protein
MVDEAGMSQRELAEIFLEHAMEAAKMKTWAIPPELLPLFLGREGLYPLFLVLVGTLDDIKESK